MLDKRMVYTCGYWKNAKTLEEAQDAKLDLICKKARLENWECASSISAAASAALPSTPPRSTAATSPA